MIPAPPFVSAVTAATILLAAGAPLAAPDAGDAGATRKAAVTRLDVGFATGTTADAARALIEARLRVAGIPILDMTRVTKPRPAWHVRVTGYLVTSLVRSVLEAGELFSVFLVDDASDLWKSVPPRAGPIEHRTETLDKWHASHELFAPDAVALAAFLGALKPPPKRRFLVGAAADGAPGVRALLVVDAPPLVGLGIADAHVTEAASGGAGRAVYATVRGEAVRRYLDVTAVHVGERLAVALGDELVAAGKVDATVTDGHFLIPMARAPAGAADALAARLRATGVATGRLKVAKVVLE